VLGSQGRCHGRPPTEPWEYGEDFTDDFRRTVELRYRLMPYVYAQAAVACREGHPMLRTLFFEYPEDGTSWLVEDEYLFGADILVAPLMEAARSRDVYLPPGVWTDYQSGELYEGARWHHLPAGEVPIVMLVRDGAAVPHARLAQSTEDIDWDEIELRVFGAGNSARGFFCHPSSGEPHLLCLRREDDGFSLGVDPLDGRVTWRIQTFP
jgi:alpha-D-xyloside xylohydrolase